MHWIPHEQWEECIASQTTQSALHLTSAAVTVVSMTFFLHICLRVLALRAVIAKCASAGANLWAA